MARVLVTGAGGVAGVNFIRALRMKTNHFIAGTEFNKYFSVFPDVDKLISTPKHSDSSFLSIIKKCITDHAIQFLHPQPTAEMLVLSSHREEIKASIYLPSRDVVKSDKYEQYKVLKTKDIALPKFCVVDSDVKLTQELVGMNFPIWIRAKSGAGGRLSVRCDSQEEIIHWIKLWVIKKKVEWSDFMIQEYLPGRDIAWDSLWYKGKLVTSFARQRLDYPFKHLTPSGITGTPTVSKIIHDQKINAYAEKAVRALDDNPHGCYSVDLKDDASGNPIVTEIDSGKFHTTIGLWGYIAMNNLNMNWQYNMPQLYLHLGSGGDIPSIEKYDIYPSDLYMIRQMDCGVWITKDDGWKSKVI